MFLPAWRNNSGSFLWCVDMEKPHFSRSKSVFLTQSTRYYSELNFAKPEEKIFLNFFHELIHGHGHLPIRTFVIWTFANIDICQ